MLLRFSVSNFLSFKNEIELSMIPGKVKQHPNHIIPGNGRYGIDILRAAILFGPNASGKSNLVKAISWAQYFIVNGNKFLQANPRRPFKLDKSCLEKPSRFQFEIKCDKKFFNYGFEVDNRVVRSEWLYEIKPTTEKLLFERRTSSNDPFTSVIEFGKSILKLNSKKENEFLTFIGRGTPANQLFLTESTLREIHLFRNIYDWFSAILVVLFPGSRSKLYPPTRQEDADFYDRLCKYLDAMDTGVKGLEYEKIDPLTDSPVQLLPLIREMVPNTTEVFAMSNGERFIVSIDKNGEVIVSKLVLKHQGGNGVEPISLDVLEESDGTLRLLDLLPILIGSTANRVFVIDELDRSLHPKLCHQFLEFFLRIPSDVNQLIANTHETFLLDLDLLRRDEIWFVEKDSSGASNVYSLEEFAPRYDYDIQKGYMLGRFEALPVIDKKIGKPG